jgi:hypothetical protein
VVHERSDRGLILDEGAEMRIVAATDRVFKGERARGHSTEATALGIALHDMIWAKAGSEGSTVE